jgi:hypothetical protein
MDPVKAIAPKQAEEALLARNYEQAIEHYEAIESSGMHACPESFNRGLAYAGRGGPGDLGQALAAFRQATAEAIDEGNSAVLKDATRAQQVVTAELLKRDARGLSAATESTLAYFDTPIVQGALLGCGATLMLAAVALTFRKSARFPVAAACIALAWCALFLKWKAHNEGENSALGVVTAKTANVTAAPESEAPLESLGEGSTVRILSRNGGVCEVQTASKKGYMQLRQLRVVSR